MVPLPSWIWKAGAVLALALALTLGWRWRESIVEQRGYDRAVAERKAADDAAFAAAVLKARDKERELQEQLDTETTVRLEEKAQYEETISDLRADARRGDSGLRAPGACVPAPADSTPKNPATAGGPRPEEGFVLLPETSESVLSAAADLAKGVRERNKLIDLYDRMRAACNADDPK